jgi:hypothetical protein
MTTPTALLLTAGLFTGMLLCLEAGLSFGLRRRVEAKDGAGPGFVALGGAVFALLGLLVGFSFSGAAGRFETKRHLIVEEAGAIETAYLRIDLLPADVRPGLRALFPRYVDARLAIYSKLPDWAAAEAEMARAEALQQEIWGLAAAACQQTTVQGVTQLVTEAMNDMIDKSLERTAALRTHAPPIIFVLLGVVALVCAFLAGYDASGRKTRSWVHSIGFAAIVAIAFYVILDLDHPWVGLIRLSADNQVLTDVRLKMR